METFGAVTQRPRRGPGSSQVPSRKKNPRRTNSNEDNKKAEEGTTTNARIAVRFRHPMSSLDPSSPLLVLVSPRGPGESQERVHWTWGPGGTCYASRALHLFLDPYVQGQNILAFRSTYLLHTCIVNMGQACRPKNMQMSRWEFGACPKP